jgi:hypothetical protein
MKVTTMCAIEMMMNMTIMCRMEMMRRFPTIVVLVMTSTVLSKDKTTTFLESLRKCLYKMGLHSIIHNN